MPNEFHRGPGHTGIDREPHFDAGERTGRRGGPWMLGAALVLAAGHLALAYTWPRLTHSTLTPGINLGWYVANLFVAASMLLDGRPLGPRRWIACGAGYAAILWLLWPLVTILQENLLLLILAVVLYGGLLRHPRYLGYLYLFLVAQRYLPAYLYPAFLLSSLLYTTLGPFVWAWHRRRERFIPLCHLLGLVLLTALLLPIVYFCTQSSAQDINQRLQEADVRSALWLSLRTSALATLVVLLMGVPLAFAMVRRSFPGRGLLDTLIDLPIVVPPPIAGITLLAFLGPKAPLGAYLETRFGLRFFDSAPGIVLAQLFVGSPFLIRASMVAFAAVDVRYENVARTLGASAWSAFLRITLPLSLRGILIGVALTWFRAMAEFGSLKILANNPRTLPILAYERFIGYSQTEAHSVGVLVLLMCLCVIAGMWIIRAMPTILGKSIGASNAEY